MYKFTQQRIKIIQATEVKVGMMVALSCSCGEPFHEVGKVSGDFTAEKWGSAVFPTAGGKKGWIKIEVKATDDTPDSCRGGFSCLPNSTATIKVC